MSKLFTNPDTAIGCRCFARYGFCQKALLLYNVISISVCISARGWLTSTAAERPRSLRSPNQARALAGRACSTPRYTASANLQMLAVSSATPAHMPMHLFYTCMYSSCYICINAFTHVFGLQDSCPFLSRKGACTNVSASFLMSLSVSWQLHSVCIHQQITGVACFVRCQNCKQLNTHGFDSCKS